MIQVPDAVLVRLKTCLTEKTISENLCIHYKKWLRFYFDFLQSIVVMPVSPKASLTFSGRCWKKGKRNWGKQGGTSGKQGTFPLFLTPMKGTNVKHIQKDHPPKRQGRILPCFTFGVKVTVKRGRNSMAVFFKELTDESCFSLVRPAHHGIMWPHEQDFSSDTIVWDIQNSQRKNQPDAIDRLAQDHAQVATS